MPQGKGYRTNQGPVQHDIKVNVRLAGDKAHLGKGVSDDGSPVFKVTPRDKGNK